MTIGRAPLAITVPVQALCEKVSPGTSPRFMLIQADPDCDPGECFENVRRKVERAGGRIQYGWAIWEWPLVYVEAEHHAVYESPASSSWRDITPPYFGQGKKCVFLPDDSSPYDFENDGVRLDNVRMSLRDDPLITKFF